jgi:archaetidylinositol phosphate synthase
MSEEQPAGDPTRVSELDRVKQEYTQAAREILARSMRGVARTKLTPDMLTLAGVSLCLAGAVLVGFEDRNEKLFFWLGGALFVVGSIADILDGALARAASKGTVFGAFLDATFDRLGEAAMLAAIGLVFMRDGNEAALVATFAAVTVHPREGRVARASRGCRLRLASRARRADLGRARPRAVGLARVADLRAGRDRMGHGRPAHALRPAPAPRAGRAGVLAPPLPRCSSDCDPL